MINWEVQQEIPHARLENGLVLRICYNHIPWSYGTQYRRELQMLTDDGWTALKSITYNDQNNKPVHTDESAEATLKEYAQYLFNHYIRTASTLQA